MGGTRHVSNSELAPDALRGAPELFPNYGVTSNGFEKPSIDTIWEAAVREFEQQIGRQLSAPTEAETQFIEAVVIWTAQYYDTLESLYYSAYFDSAQGEQLDHLLSFMGFRRLPRRDATGEVTFYAASENGNTSDVTIPAGTRVVSPGDETSPQIIFQTSEPATLPAGQQRVERVPIKALDPMRTNLDLGENQVGSETNVPAFTIKEILDSHAGVSRVENPLPTGESGIRDETTQETYSFVAGRDREIDSEFRRRYLNSLALGGQATKDAVEAAIRNAGDGSIVSACRVEETLEITENADGSFSGRQLEPIVVLSEDTPITRDAVSQAIYDTRAAGIESVGTVSGTAEQLDGQSYSTGLAFTPGTKVDAYVDAEIVVDGTFPDDGIGRIKSNIIDIIGGEDTNGNYVSGSDIGEDIYYNEVLGAIMDNDVPGIFDYNSVTLDRVDPPAATANLSISTDEVARTAPENITITPVSGTRA